MKISKKTGLGLGVLSALILLFAAVPVRRALAATYSKADLTGATYTFLDGGNISVEITGGPTVIFTDKKINSNPKNYVPSDTFCDPGGGNYGITIGDGVDLKGNPITGTIRVGNQVGANCTAIAQQTIDNIKNPSQAGATDYQWDGSEIKSLNGASDSTTFDQVPNGDDVAFGEKGGGTCGYGKFILLNDANGNTGKYYELRQRVATNKGSEPENLPADLAKYLDPAKCHLNSGPTNVSLAGKQGQAAAGGSGSTADAGDSCDLDANGLSLAWLMCPMLAAANDLVNGSDQSGTGGLLGLFEGQLSFNVNRDLGTVGGVADNRVQTTWSMMKNIATAILVIIMLIAIFSQSISAGPFDAYTLRKIFPRLIAAAILIQISWYLAAWIVDLVDDIGNSLFDLLYAPFGGAQNMQLGHLLANGGVGGATAAAINYLVILPVLVVLGLAALPTVLFMAFAAIVGIFTAIVVLVFRKIIIIVCLIFAPLALLAWILPGTQRYWKMWYDNFLKVLFMFPLIIALIAGGHIFAYIAGTQGNGVLLNFIIITIGVFGPLFVLPKTFKWGGQFMSMAGGAISNVGDKTRQAGKEPITGWTKRNVQGKFAKKYVPKGAPGSNLRNRTMNSLLGGRVIPTRYRAAILTQSGDKWNEERDAEAQALLKRKGETAMTEGYKAGILNDDKTGFAKYDRDANGNMLDKNGAIAYQKVGVDDDGEDIFHDRAGHVTTDFKDAKKIDVDTYDEADKRTLKGVAAMKQMWVDLADQSDNSHERKMAVRQLTATSSWPEIQGSLSRDGNKVIDTEAWNKSITTSTEDYPKVLRSRVDATPHIDTWAKGQLAAEKAKDPGKVWTKKQEKDFISQKRVLYSIKDQMGNEDFQTQSEGYWEEVARAANVRDPASGELTKEAKDIQEALRSRFASIHGIGGTAPQQLLGHLVGGSVQAKVDKALGAGTNIKEYVNPNTPLGGQTSKPAVRDRWSTTIPTTVDLADPSTRSKYKTSLLTTIDTSSGKAPSPAAKTLAEGIAYGAAGTREEAEQLNVLHELKFTPAASPEGQAAYNGVIDEIHKAYDQRALEAVQKATASYTDPAEVARIKTTAETYAAAQKAQFTKI